MKQLSDDEDAQSFYSAKTTNIQNESSKGNPNDIRKRADPHPYLSFPGGFPPADSPSHYAATLSRVYTNSSSTSVSPSPFKSKSGEPKRTLISSPPPPSLSPSLKKQTISNRSTSSVTTQTHDSYAVLQKEITDLQQLVHQLTSRMAKLEQECTHSSPDTKLESSSSVQAISRLEESLTQQHQQLSQIHSEHQQHRTHVQNLQHFQLQQQQLVMEILVPRVKELDEKVDMVHSNLSKAQGKLTKQSVNTQGQVDLMYSRLSSHLEQWPREFQNRWDQWENQAQSRISSLVNVPAATPALPDQDRDLLYSVVRTVYNHSQVYLDDRLPVMSFHSPILETKAKRPIDDALLTVIADRMRYNTAVAELTIHLASQNSASLKFLLTCLRSNHHLKTLNFFSDSGMELTLEMVDEIDGLASSNDTLIHIRFHRLHLSQTVCENLAYIADQHYKLNLELRSCRIPSQVMGRLLSSRITVGN